MGQTQGKDKDLTNNQNNDDVSPRKNKKKKKKEKHVKPNSDTLQKKRVHVNHFELSEKAKSSVNSETSLGLFYYLPNEILSHMSNYLSWKEALGLQTCSR